MSIALKVGNHPVVAGVDEVGQLKVPMLPDAEAADALIAELQKLFANFGFAREDQLRLLFGRAFEESGPGAQGVNGAIELPEYAVINGVAIELGEGFRSKGGDVRAAGERSVQFSGAPAKGLHDIDKAAEQSGH